MKHLTDKNEKNPERQRENMSVHHTKKKKHKEKDKHRERGLSHKEKHQSKRQDGSKEKRSEKYKHKEHNSVSKKLSVSTGESVLKSKHHKSPYKSASNENMPFNEEIKRITSELVGKVHDLCKEASRINGISSNSVLLADTIVKSEIKTENARHSPCPKSLIADDIDKISKKRKQEVVQYNGGNHINIDLLPCSKKLKFDCTGSNYHSDDLDSLKDIKAPQNNFNLNLPPKHLKEEASDVVKPDLGTNQECLVSSELAVSSDKLCSKPGNIEDDSKLSVPQVQNNGSGIAHCDIPRDRVESKSLNSEAPADATNITCSPCENGTVSSNCTVKDVCEVDYSLKSEAKTESVKSCIVISSHPALPSVKHDLDTSLVKHELLTPQKSEKDSISRPRSSENSVTKHSSHKTSADSHSHKIKTHSDKHHTKERHNSQGKDKTKKHGNSSDLSKNDTRFSTDKVSKVSKDQKASNKTLTSSSAGHKKDYCRHGSSKSDSGSKQGLCLRCRQKLTSQRNVSIQCKRDRHDKLQEKVGVSQRIPRLPQGMDMRHLKYGKYIRLEVYPNGGAALLHLYWDEIAHMHRKELRCLAEEFLKVI